MLATPDFPVQSISKKHKKGAKQVASSRSSRFAKLERGSSKSAKRRHSNRSIDKDNLAEPPPAEVDEGGTRTIHISNLTNERQAMKVKCSDNYLYSVDPVYTFVEPGSRISVEVVRNNGALKLDEMVFVTTKAKADDQHAKSLFTGKTGNLAAIVPLLSATA
uniref:Major sperm protein n=1 Tax=Parascaris equorum TaxID=6256 RepID=A0A914S8C4_PAREQ